MDRIQDENARLTFAARITTARVGIGADRGVEHRHMRQAHLATMRQISSTCCGPSEKGNVCTKPR